MAFFKPRDRSRPPPAPAAAPTPRGKPPRRRFRFWRSLLILGLLAGTGAATFYALWAARFDISNVGEMPQLAEVYDQDGTLYSRLRGENRIIVPLKDISPFFINALIAREDTRFYKHLGIDPRGIARAAFRNLIRRRAAEGASTITQQLARNSLPLGGKTLNRKIIEAFVAARIEGRYSKDQILEFYINRIYYGNRLYGLETASQAYFGKAARDLTLGEAAMMAGLIRSPSRFSPVKNPAGATRERDTVLGRMEKLGFISAEDAARARRQPVAKARLRPLGFQDNYAMDAISRELKDLLDDDQLADGNLKIYTTLDAPLEKAAVEAIETHLAKIEARPGFEHPKKRNFSPADPGEKAAETPYLQGALVVIDNRTGGIKALVGGRDFAQSSFNRAISARRQVGSSFKPFVYAAAFQKGLFPGQNIPDGPIQPGELHDPAGGPAPNWSPGNSDGQFNGPQPAEVGLIRSRNTMSVRVGEAADFDPERDDALRILGFRYTGDVPRLAASVGLGEVPNAPTSYLGAFESDLKTLTSAYSVFPNAGARRPAYFIERVDDADGQVLYRAPQDNAERALHPGIAWMTSTVLEKVVKSGSAAEARNLGWTRPAAGKTGTTNDYKDAWFVGYTSSLTCGVWVGLDQPQPIMARGYGAALALPIWVQTMNKADARRYPAGEFKPAEPLQRVQLCRHTSLLATAGCAAAAASYEIAVPVSLLPKVKPEDRRLLAHGAKLHEPAYCDVHQGAPESPFGEIIPGEPLPGRPTPPPGREENLPGRMFRSFRKLFGG